MKRLTQTELGVFPSDWQVRRFDSLFSVQQGKQVSKRNRVGQDQRPFLRTKNVSWGRLNLTDLDEMHFTAAEQERLALRHGDLLICEGGDIGRTAIWQNGIANCYYQNHLHRARLREGTRADVSFVLFWLWYAFNVGNVYFGRGNVTTIPNLSQSKLCELPLPVPPLDEQRKIGVVLELVQRAIEHQERLLALTAELKQTLLQQLFTHGLRNEPQKHSELGPIPQSWRIISLGRVMGEDPKNGLYKHSSHYGTGTLILRINDFSNDGDIVVGASNRALIDEEEQKTYCLRKDDIVVNRVNSLSHLGKTAVIGELSELMVFESNMMRFRADSSKALPHYLLRWMNSPVYKAQVIGSAKRAVAQSSINQGNLKAINLPLPSLEEQAEIIYYFDQIEAKLSLHRRKRAALSALFRTLLHQLMTAQVRLNDFDLRELEM